MKRLLVVLAIALAGCAAVPSSTRTASPTTALASMGQALRINLDDLFPAKDKVEVSCEPDVPCVVHHKLNDEVNEQSVKEAVEHLDAAEEAGASSFLLELNTPGGSVDDGFDLAKRIEDAKIPVVCVVDGKAASMGFYILQSCPVRKMTKRSTLMAHEPSMNGRMGGPANDWYAIAEALRALRDAMAEHCNSRMTTTIQEYHKRTDGSLMWWFNWKEAQKFHAIDAIAASVGAELDALKAPKK